MTCCADSTKGEALQPEKLAAEYEVTLRTVQRDLNESWIFWNWKSKRQLPRCGVQAGVAVSAGHHALCRNCGAGGLYPQLNDALIRRWLQTSYQNALLVRGPSYEDLSGHENTFNLLQQAIDRCCTVGFRYLKTDGPKVTQRPQTLPTHQPRGHLVPGCCRSRQAQVLHAHQNRSAVCQHR